MEQLANSARRSDWYFRISARGLLEALGRGVGRAIGAARTYVVEHRNAKVAEELYRSLSRLSDAELARRGLDRHQLARLVKERLD